MRYDDELPRDYTACDQNPLDLSQPNKTLRTTRVLARLKGSRIRILHTLQEIEIPKWSLSSHYTTGLSSAAPWIPTERTDNTKLVYANALGRVQLVVLMYALPSVSWYRIFLRSSSSLLISSVLCLSLSATRM